MKIKVFSFITLIVLSFAQECFSQDKFTVDGFLSGFEDGTKIIIGPYFPTMAADMDHDKEITLDKGRFTLEGTLQSPTQFSLRVIPVENPSEYENTSFWLENKSMTIRGKKGDLANAKVSGSQIQDEYEELANVGRLKWKEINQIKDSVLTYKLSEQALIPLRKVFAENMATIERDELRFVYSHPNYLSCVAKLCYFINFSPQKILKQDVVDFYKSLGYDFKTNEYGSQISAFISGVKLEHNKLNPGDKALKFTLPDSLGNVVSLESLGGKVVLIDFWASGCGPCRMEHKNYLEVYQKYQPKGFEILSVSQDQSKSRWIKAMHADNMIWKSVLDANREVTKMYQVFAIPANYLVNPDGVVIAQDLRGSELAEVLKEMFKE